MTELLFWLNFYLGQGSGSGGPPAPFKGVWKLAEDLGRTVDTGWPTTDVESAVRAILTRIRPRGKGAGDGPHCLIGNDRMLRALMATSAGISGASGWRHDPRTGLLIYHYLGIPYYRTDFTDSETANTGFLLGANLGPTGLNLVHAYGAAESYGVQIDQEPTVATQAQQQFVVHGAWAPVAWDKFAVYGVAEVPYGVD